MYDNRCNGICVNERRIILKGIGINYTNIEDFIEAQKQMDDDTMLVVTFKDKEPVEDAED